MTEELKFVHVGELAKGITENILPDSDELIGRSLQLNGEDSSVWQLTFLTQNSLTWETRAADQRRRSGSAAVRVTSPRKNIFLVDYVAQDRRATSISHVLDLTTHSATSVIGMLPTRSETQQDPFSRVTQGLEPTTVSAQLIRATIDGPFPSPDHPHGPTADLIGKRIRYTYSQTEVYEHIYLNENLYTWHCLAGVEKGLADTDRCHYTKIREGLYLFVWREKIVPTLGVVVIDLMKMKTTGKLFGYATGNFGQLTNAPIGAFATLLNITDYDE